MLNIQMVSRKITKEVIVSKKLLCALLVISLLALPLPLLGCKEFTVSVIAPTHESTITTPAVEVRGFVSDAKATVWVNDAIVAVSKKGYYSTNLELAEGENEIKVVAARGEPDKWKDVVGRTVTVTYTPE